MRKSFYRISIIVCLFCFPLAIWADGREIRTPQQASTWMQIGPQGGELCGLARNPKAPNELYTFGPIGQVYRSTNNGSSWQQTNWLPFSVTDDPGDIEVDCAGNIFILTDETLFRSSDRAQTFASLKFGSNFEGGWIGRIAIDPVNPAIIYVSGQYEEGDERFMAVAKSLDSGNTWSFTKLGESARNSWGVDIAVSRTAPSTIYFCGHVYNEREFIFRSTDAGSSWIDVTPGFLKGGIAGNSPSVDQIIIDPYNSSKAFVKCSVGGTGYVIRTSNSGVTWSRQTSPSSLWGCIYLDPTAPVMLYIVSDSLYKSTNSGKTWKVVCDWHWGKVTGMLVAGTQIICATSGCGIIKSNNGGLRFLEKNDGIRSVNTRCLALVSSPVENNGSGAPLIYVAAENGLFKSSNGGKTWWSSPIEPLGLVADMVVPKSDSNRIYVSILGCLVPSVYRSVDGGKSFEPLMPGEGWHDYRLVVNPNRPDNIIAAGNLYLSGIEVMGINLSVDGGGTWKKIKIRNDDFSIATVVALNPKNPNTLYVGGRDAKNRPVLYKSVNGGYNWNRISNPEPYSEPTCIAVVSSNIVYAGSGNGGIYKSKDGGLSWSMLLESDLVRGDCLAINPSNPNEIFAGSCWGAFFSSDGGTTWTDASEGLPSKGTNFGIIAISIDPITRKVYIGMAQGGIYCRRF